MFIWFAREAHSSRSVIRSPTLYPFDNIEKSYGPHDIVKMSARRIGETKGRTFVSNTSCGNASRNKGWTFVSHPHATYCGHLSAAVKPGIAVARYSE